MFILLLLVLISLLIWLYVRAYRKNWSQRLTLGITLSKTVFYEGDHGSLIETVTNKKFMPLWWAEIQYLLPGFITVDDGENRTNADYKNTISAFSYEMVTKKIPFTALRRGFYRIPDAEILTQDLFFKYRLIKKYPQSAELYVLPDIRPVEDFSIAVRRITGEIIAKRHYIEDQFQLRGIRDYHPFDSFRIVNWNATAKTGEFKVNQYDYTTSQEVYILLDFDPRTNWDRQALKEDMIRVAAFLLKELSASGIPVGLVTNVADIQDGEEISLPCKNGASQRESFMKLLSRINTEKITRPFAEILDRVAAGSKSPEYILLSYSAAPKLQEKIKHLRAGHWSLQWVLLTDKGTQTAVLGHDGFYLCEVS